MKSTKINDGNNIKQCGQCTKSSCYGCTNYVQGKAQQETASSIILTELAKVSGLVLLVFILFIII